MAASPSFPSCEYKNPLIILDPDGQSDIFEYNLKPGRCFDAKGYIHLAVESSRFVPATLTPPEITFWTLIQNVPDSEIIQKINDDLINGSLNPLIINNSYAFRLPLTKLKEADGFNLRVKTVSDKAKFEISGINLDEVLNQVNKGKRPLLNRNFFGKPILKFLEKPLAPKPQLTLVFHYKICSYLGNSGAGKVVKTFSLLPGEKTVLSIRNFTSNTETSVLSQNVFDSFSENSANELQTILENETAQDSSTSSASNHTSEVGGGLSVGVNLGFVNIGLGGGGGVTNQGTVANTAAYHVAALSSAINSHVEQSSYNREISVNTETSATFTSETEDSSIREIENINLSRVLNFIFKQVNQEYLTITYLNDVSLVYSNGYPETKQVVKLNNIDTLLKSVLKEEEVDGVRELIFASLCSIYDYEGNKVSFIEKVEEEVTDCIGGGGVLFTNTFVRKRADLLYEYHGVEVPGIIMEVKKRVLPTSSLITEAMLGQGEALDCYNQKLQAASTVKAELDNKVLEQQIQTINEITDPVERAKLYKKVFGSCCDLPQSLGDVGVDVNYNNNSSDCNCTDSENPISE